MILIILLLVAAAMYIGICLWIIYMLAAVYDDND